MKIKTIQQQIDDLGFDKIKDIQKKYTFGEITPYEYQCVMFDEIGKRIGRYINPFYIKASVSAGKTIGFAMVASRCREMGLSMAILARQAEIVSQDSEELTNFGVPNSVYCAGLNTKSAYFPIVVGSEGTVANGLFKALGDFAPMVLGIDECHQVDWEDLVDSIAKNESYDEMTRSKDEPYMINGVVVEKGTKMPDERMNTVAKGAGRSQYTVIIRTLQERCRKVHGKELRIFGMTGSEFRGTTPILVEDMKQPGFWREQVTNIDTNYLVEFGSVVPTTFGATDGVGYDLEEFKANGIDGIQDFDDKTMKAMEKKIHESSSLTHKIMQQVYEFTKNRNAVLVTCAGQRHCREAAEALPEGTTYAIITEKTGAKQRQKILDDVRAGKIKFTFQVMALTTGVNVPNWDTSVLLRKIGSLTLLIQLLGRGMRLLRQQQIEMGMTKDDHLVLDYAGTMDDLGQLYFDPILEQAQFQRKFDGKKEPKTCPICGTLNSFHARRCMHVDDNGNRCEYFWKSRRCENQIDERTKEVLVKGCDTENDIAARICRGCGETLLDPNLKLSGKHYQLNDWCDVLGFDVELTKQRTGVIYKYLLRDASGVEFTARELFFPESDNKICKTIWKNKGVMPHVMGRADQTLMAVTRNAIKIFSMKDKIMVPKRVTHRINGKREDVIHRKDFGFGAEL